MPMREIYGQPPKKSKGVTVAIIAAVTLAISLYAFVDPTDARWGVFFPKCIFKEITGWQCSACGLQRSLHALFQGDVIGALRCNWFIVFSLSYLFGVLATRRWCRPDSKLRRFFWGSTGAWIYISLYLTWLVVRNILGI